MPLEIPYKFYTIPYMLIGEKQDIVYPIFPHKFLNNCMLRYVFLVTWPNHRFFVNKS